MTIKELLRTKSLYPVFLIFILLFYIVIKEEIPFKYEFNNSQVIEISEKDIIINDIKITYDKYSIYCENNSLNLKTIDNYLYKSNDNYYSFNGELFTQYHTSVYLEGSKCVNGYEIYDYELMDYDPEYWNNKTWVAFGTSITDDKDSNHDGRYTGLYPKYLVEYSGMNLINKGYDTGRIDGIIHYLVLSENNKELIKNADLITIEGGINDWYSARPLGKITDTKPYYYSLRKYGIDFRTGGTRGSFIGALYEMIMYIKQVNPSALIVLLTDCEARDGRRGDPDYMNYKYLYFNSYSKAIVEVGKRYDVEVIDVGSNCGINQYSHDCFMDNVHLNKKGAQIYASYIWEYLKKMEKPKVNNVYNMLVANNVCAKK